MKENILKLIEIYSEAIEHINTLPPTDGITCNIESIGNFVYSWPEDYKPAKFSWFASPLAKYLINKHLLNGVCDTARHYNLFNSDDHIQFIHDFTDGYTYLTGVPWACNTETVLKLLQYRLDRLIEFKDWTPKQI